MLGLQVCSQQCLAFCEGLGDLNSGSHSCLNEVSDLHYWASADKEQGRTWAAVRDAEQSLWPDTLLMHSNWPRGMQIRQGKACGVNKKKGEIKEGRKTQFIGARRTTVYKVGQQPCSTLVPSV